jgi:hypothetical protein
MSMSNTKVMILIVGGRKNNGAQTAKEADMISIQNVE